MKRKIPILTCALAMVLGTFFNAQAQPGWGDCTVCHVPPTVTDFVLPSSHNALNVPITQLQATDQDNQVSSLARVAGYMVTTSSSAPTSSAQGWTSTPPSEYTFEAAGSHTLYAWAKDPVGNVSAGVSASVNVTIATNEAPVADAGPDQTEDENVAVSLDGSNSYDADDGIASILWEQIDGVPVTITDADMEIATFVTPDVGPAGESLTFQLTVTDYSGAVSTDTCVVNVTWVNIPPIADAGPDQTASENDAVALSAANSSDPDGTIDGYLWEQTDGPAVTLSDPAAVEPTFTAPGAGENGTSLTFQLTVTDDGGLTATDSCVVNISPSAPTNQPPTADAGGDQSAAAGETVTLNGAGSSDPEDAIDGYRWEQISGPAVTLSDPAAVAPTFTAPGAGENGTSLTFQLTVTDDGGLTATDSCVVNISPSAPTNQPPTADAGGDQSAAAGETVTLNGAGSSDPEDAIDGYRWEQISGPAVTLSDPAVAAPTFTALDTDANGVTLEFRLTVIDNGGLQATDTCIVSVASGTVPPTPTDNQPPTADAGSDIRVKERSFVTLDGTGSSDPDDGIAKYCWRQVSGPGVDLSNGFTAEPNFQAPMVRRRQVRLVFKLIVEDYAGNRSKDKVTVTVANDDEDEKKNEEDDDDEEEKEHDDDKDDDEGHEGHERR